jgi:nucleotide-binding universal stress UspA family protein
MIHFHCTRILIPVDFSETSLLAFKHGAYLASQTKASLYLLHVINTPFISQDMFLPVVTLEDQSLIQDKVTQKLGEIAADIKAEYGIDVESIIRTGSPFVEIGKVAKEIDASIIIMGTHGYSPIKEIMIGSVALKVITKSPCPTMVMNSDAEHKGYNKILLPIDDTINSRQKVNYALELAKKIGASVHALGLLTKEEENDKPGMELVLHQISLIAKQLGVEYHSEIHDNLKNRAVATVNYASQIGADLMVIMTDQEAELTGLFLGPYSQQIIHQSKIPVIAIKPKEIFIDEVTYLPGTSSYF